MKGRRRITFNCAFHKGIGDKCSKKPHLKGETEQHWDAARPPSYSLNRKENGPRRKRGEKAKKETTPFFSLPED